MQGLPGSMVPRTESASAFAIVRFNAQTYDRGSVVAVIRKRSSAETAITQIRDLQESSEWIEGWRYFLEKTDLIPGMDPQEATRAREAAFTRRNKDC